MVMEPEVDTFLNVCGMSQSANAGYLNLSNKLGKVIVAKLPTVKNGDKKPSVFWEKNSTTGAITEATYNDSDGQIGNWKILLHGKDFYKIKDVISIPHRDEGVFIETAFYKTSLKNLIGKWYFAVAGTIPFVNGCYWTCDGATEKKGKEKASG
jgi:hypothetical protein